MGDNLTAIVSPVFKILTDLVKQHMGYITSSTEYVKNMDTKKRELNGISTDVKKKVETNNSNNLEVPARVPEWLEEVDKIENDVESILKDGSRCFKRYQTGRKASKITLQMVRLIEEQQTTTWTNIPKGLAKVYSTKESTSASSSHDIKNDLKSRDEIFKDALDSLKQDDNTQVLALCGMGGVGKTTMMEQLKEIVVHKKVFEWVVKVVIGQETNMFSIQQAIAEYIGEPLSEKTLTVRAELLRKKYEHMLKKGKILVILDDIWKMVELKDIGLSPFPNGCKLLLTSRDENVCTQIAVDASAVLKTLRVPVMEEVEAQNFFWKITEVSKEDDPDLNKIGCDIVRKCGFLPLAIKLIAANLKLKEKPMWRNTLKRLEINDLDDRVQKIIEISYNHIEEEEDKEVLLLCGLFRDDFNIPVEDLVRYVWGLKLLMKFQYIKDARDQIHTSVSNLKSANLLMDGDYAGCVKLHDLVLSFVVGSDSKGDHASIINHGDTTKIMSGREMNEACKRISLTCMGMSKFPIDFKYPNLSLLKLMKGDSSLVFPEDFYEKMEKLEVLAYDDIQYPLLPGQLQCSTNLRTLCLRTLCLRDCFLVFDLSPIGDLVNLEVLSFANCCIQRLPSAIEKLKKLRLLDLTGCVDLHIDEGVLKGLCKLEELYMRARDEMAISFTDGNTDELIQVSKNLFALELEFCNNNISAKTMSFEKLERFKISMGRLLEYIEEERMHSFENTLMLETSRDELLESGVNELFKKTEVLHLKVNDVTHLEDILTESRHSHQASFYDLRVLHVSECTDLKSLFTVSMAKGLKKLERLTVSSCPVLEVLINIENTGIEAIRFPKLKYLCLDGLPELESLCNIVNVIELPELVTLTLDGLPKVTSIYSKNDGTSSILNKEVIIPKLEMLKIRSMENLKGIWPYEFNSSEVNVCMLREIHVEGCDSLVNLFPNNPMPLLRHLETIEVWRCGSIEVVFDIDLGCIGEIKQDGHSSLRSIDVYDSENLREIWRVQVVNTDDHLVSEFQAVEDIRIKRCKRFRNIFTPSTISFDFRALTKIYIYDCGLNDTASNDELVESNKEEEKRKAEILEEANDDNIVFSSNHLLHSFQQLRVLRLGNYEGVEVVFEIDLESATNQQLQILPHLQTLYLINMERMSHVWKCNWNRFNTTHQMPHPFLFHNLTTIDLWRCNRIKYLLSPLMAKHLSNLNKLDILSCEGIEEVVSSRDDGDVLSTTTSFPCLDELKLSYLPCLERIDGGGLSHQILQFPPVDVTCCSFLYHNSKKIDIDHCDALSSVIPSHAIRRIQMLEELTVLDCKSIKHVFEIEGVDSNTNVGGERSSDAMTIPRSTKTSYLLALPNLRILYIFGCDLLEHILVSSALGSLKKLEELTVEGCKAMQVIVKEDMYREHTTTSKVVAFPCLKSLRLDNLPNLKGFLIGMDEFEFKWPSLDYVEIYGCPQMIKFTPGHCDTPKLKYVHTEFGKPNLECGLNFHLE